MPLNAREFNQLVTAVVHSSHMVINGQQVVPVDVVLDHMKNHVDGDVMIAREGNQLRWEVRTQGTTPAAPGVEVKPATVLSLVPAPVEVVAPELPPASEPPKPPETPG